MNWDLMNHLPEKEEFGTKNLQVQCFAGMKIGT